MSFTNSTPNYHLPQYEQSDKPAYLSDFNNAMDTIDTAIHDNSVNTSQGSADLQVAINQLNETKQQVDDAIGQINQLKIQTEQLQEQATQVTQNATDALNDATEAKSNSTQATTIASQASSTANSALSTANSNYTEIQSLDARVESLENNQEMVYITSKANITTGALSNTTMYVTITIPESDRKPWMLSPSIKMPVLDEFTIDDATSMTGTKTFVASSCTINNYVVTVGIYTNSSTGVWGGSGGKAKVKAVLIK